MAETQSKPAIGSTPAKAIQPAIDTAKDSNRAQTGSVQSMLDSLPNRHPIDIPGTKS